MNAVADTFMQAIRATGAIPCLFGPGADVHRVIPFEAGKAIKSNVPTNYANCRKRELEEECAARGLNGLGIVNDIINRLVRSDTGTLVDADLILLGAANPTTDLDNDTVKVSSCTPLLDFYNDIVPSSQGLSLGIGMMIGS